METVLEKIVRYQHFDNSMILIVTLNDGTCLIFRIFQHPEMLKRRDQEEPSSPSQSQTEQPVRGVLGLPYICN
jgi:hypothetical protein